MSRRGNCHDKAVAESFFQLLKRKRIRLKNYATRAEAGSDAFDYIKIFYTPTRRYSHNGMPSPVDFENKYATNTKGV